MSDELETLVADFRRRYVAEEAFREIVHQYLEVSMLEKMQFGLTRAFDQRAYADIAERLVERYRDRVRADLDRAERLEAERATLRHLERVQAQAEAEEAKAEFELERHQASPALEALSADEAPEAEVETRLIERLKRQLEWSGLVEQTEEGLQFGDAALVKALEKRFLDEILSELETEDGLPGFFGKTQRIYEGTVRHWGMLEDLAELPHVDWLRSTIHARTLGYQRPVYPHLIAGKMDAPARRTVDAAISLDNSMSMTWGGRFDAAKRTTLALFALMTRLNPKNRTYLSYFATELEAISPAFLVRTLKPKGLTRTDLALEWLLSVTEDSELALAYLITDGSPFGPSGIRKTCERIAREFSVRPHVFLRIFLVDATSSAEKTIRKIGRAAGPTTKMATIDSQSLAKGVIKDVADALSAMRFIEEV